MILADKDDMRSWAIVWATAAICLVGCRADVDPTVKATPIKVVEDNPGIGLPAKAGDLATIAYRVTTEAGNVLLDESGFRFVVGSGAVIAGVDDAVTGMRVGGKRTFLCPPHLHWGREGYGNGVVPPNETLTIHVELETLR